MFALHQCHNQGLSSLYLAPCNSHCHVNFNNLRNEWFVCQQAVEMLEKGGAHEENYLIKQVTHVITEDDDHPEISEAQDIFDLPVVSVSTDQEIMPCLTVC